MQYEILFEDYGNDIRESIIVESGAFESIRAMRENDSGEIRVFLNSQHVISWESCSSDFEINVLVIGESL